MTRQGIVGILLTALISITLTGCATNTTHERTTRGAGIGAAVGAVSGAIIGYQSDKSSGALRGALIGGAAGGAVGAGIGAYMDKQQTEFEQELEQERARNQIEIERQQNEILKLTLQGEVTFDFDSARIKPTFYRSLDRIAEIMQRYPQTDIVVAGHTDNIGAPRYNLDLSLRRANAVADYFIARGVSRARLATEGHGDLAPVASNMTAEGRSLNRRVEIFVVPRE